MIEDNARSVVFCYFYFYKTKRKTMKLNINHLSNYTNLKGTVSVSSTYLP